MFTTVHHQEKLPTRKKMLVEALEHRILYSADAGALLLDHSEATPSAEVRIIEATAANNTNTLIKESANQQHELVFVDTAIEDYQVLIDDILAQKDSAKQIEIILLNKETDGISQISRVLDTYDNVSAIHLLGHGNEAELNLGTSTLTLDSINQLYADAFQNIGRHLTADADILIYGCNFGQGSDGLLAIERLGQLTGADIAASNDLTGMSTQAADWDLEVNYGEINTQTIIAQSATNQWSGTLVTATFQEGLDGYTGTQDTYVSVNNPNTDFGNDTSVMADDTSASDAALLRFDNLFGAGPNQIAIGSTINSVTLSINVTNTDSADDVTLHRMFSGWTEASTYNSLTNGIQKNNIEAGSASLLTIDAGASGWNNLSSAGLTAAVQAWANGETNYGFAFISDSADEWRFNSSEVATASLRPYLTINYTAAPSIVATAGSVNYIENAAPLIIDSAITVTDADSANLSSATVTISNNYNNGQDILTFSDKYGITGSWDAGTGTLTLSGSATVSNYQKALREVTYQNTSESPNTATRTISIRANDGTLNSNIATRDITVTQVNDAGTFGGNISATTNEDTGTSGTVTFTDAIDGYSANTFAINTPASNGVAAINTAGNWTYTPSAHYNGADNFTVQVTDDDGNVETQIISITVTAVNDAGTFGGDLAVTTDEDTGTSATVTFTDTADGFTTPNFSLVSGASNGVAAINAAGNWTYTPSANYNGSDSFTIQVTDDDGNVETQVISITVTQINDAGTFGGNLSATTNEDTGTSGTVTFVDAIDGYSTNNFTINTVASNGTATIDANGNWTYTPTANYNGSDSFTVQVTDDDGNVETQVISITVTQINDAGTFGGNLSATTNEDTATSGTVTFTDTADGFTTPNFSLVSGASNGTAAINAAGNWTYTPSANYNGSDSFTIQVTDDDGNVETQVISITVTQINDAGTFGGNLSATTDEDTGVSGTVTFTDTADGFTTPNFSLVSGASNGVATINAAGNWTYTPSANYNGSDSFTIQVTDDDGNVETQVISITVTQINDAGTFGGNLSATTNEDTGTSGTVTFVDAIDGYSTNNFTINTVASNGTATIDANGNWTYTPTANYNGSDSFTVQVTDDDGNVETQVISITVTQINDAGTFGGNLSATTDEDTGVSGTVTFTDTADGFTTPNFSLVSGASNGTAAINAAGNWTYTPSANYNGSDSFTVQVTDDDGNVETRVISINVAQINDLPANNVPGTQLINEDTPLVFSSTNGNLISISDTDSNSDDNEFTLTATNGTITLSGTSGLTFITGDGTADTTMRLRGSIANINAALDGMTFNPTTNYNGGAVLTITTTDSVLLSLDIDTGLLGRYAFENTGYLGEDSSPAAGNNAATVGVNAVADGTRGNVLSLDGTSNSNLQISGLFGNAANVTLAAWVNLNVADSSGAEVISLGDNVAIRLDSFGNLTAFYYDGINFRVNTYATTLAGTGWHHVAYTFDDVNNVSTLYLDGVAVSTQFESESISYSLNTNSFIGTHGNGQINEDFNGLIDEVRIYNRALTENEINTLAQDLNMRDRDTVAITVTQINDAGTFGGNLSATTDEDTGVSGTVTFTDTADGFTTPNFSLVSGASNGTAAINAAGNWTYTPSANYNGSDSFTIQVTDDDGNVETQVISITVTQINDAGTFGGNLSATTDEDTGVSGTVTFTDTADGFTTPNFSLVSGASNGTAAINAAGNWTYTPSANYNGSDSFTIQVTDDDGNVETQVISITVTQINDAGTFGGNLSATTNEDTGTSGTVTFVDAIDGYSTNNFTINTVASNGTATIDANGNWTYTPTANYNGSDSFTVQVTDDDGNVETQVISITVTQINDAGTFGGNLSATTDEDTGVSGTVTFTDTADGFTTPNFSLVSGASNGTAAINAAGNWTYTPSANYNGSDSFTIQVTDDDGNVETQVISITVTQINDAGTFGGNLSATTDEDTGVSGTVTFTDTADGFTTPNFSLVSGASNGTAAINAAGNWTYTPSANYNGSDSFTIQVTDDDGNVETRVISITVTQINDAGTFGGNLSATTNEDNATSGTVTFTDAIDGYSSNTFAINTAASNGTASIDANGNWTYTPTANYNGSDSFTVQVTDDDGNVETQVINIIITPVADSGIFTGDLSATTNEDNSIGGTVIFTDTIDGYSANNFAIYSPASNGVAAIDINGNWTYTPTANYNGADSFAIQVVDDDGNVETQVISITVTQINDAGTFGGNLSATTDEDTGVSGTVTFTDTADGFTTPNFSLVSGASNGTAAINAAGNWTYTPSANYNGSDSFTIQVTDDDGNVETQVISITVTQINDAGTFGGNLSATTDEDTGVSGTVTFTDTADGFTTPNFSLVSGASNGVATINAAGNWTYTPSANYNGSDSFTIQVTDDDGNVETQVISITVTQINDAGTFGGNLSATTNEDTGTSGTVTFVDAIDGYSTNNFTINTVASNGTATIDANGNWTYTPTANYNGSDSFTVQVTDDDGNVETQVISITVTQINDAGTFGGNLSATTDEDTGVSGTVTFTDTADGFTTPNFSLVSGASNGTAAINAAGNWTYTPSANYNGSDSFTIQVTDDDGNVETQVISITVTQINDAGTFGGNLSATTDEDTGVSGTVTFTDTADGFTTPNFSLVSGASNGTAAINAAGNWTYTPSANYNGSDSFTIQVTDDDGNVETQVISINITPINDAPALTSGQATPASGTEDVTYTINKTDLLQGYTDVDGDTLSISGLSISEGIIVDNGSSYTVTHSENFFGPVTFTYNIVDGNGGLTAASLTYNVIKVNDAPVAQGAYTFTFNDTIGLDKFTNVSGNLIATDPDDASDTLVWSVANGIGSYGRLTVTANGNFTYILDSTAVNALNFGENPTDLFVVTVSDPDGATDTRAISINLFGADDLFVNQTPFAAFLLSDQESNKDKSKEEIEAEILIFDANVNSLNTQVNLTETNNAKKLAIEAAINSFLSTTDNAFNTEAEAVSTIATGTLRQDIVDLNYQNISYTIFHQTYLNEESALGGVNFSEVKFNNNDSPFIKKSNNSNAVEATGVAVTAGAVWWALRATGLLASVITSVPAWRQVDLLAVLPEVAGDDDAHTDDLLS